MPLLIIQLIALILWYVWPAMAAVPAVVVLSPTIFIAIMRIFLLVVFGKRIWER